MVDLMPMVSQELALLPADNHRLSNFCGELDTHLRQIEARLHVEIANRGNHFKITGIDSAVKAACVVMQKLFEHTENEWLTAEVVHLAMQDSSIDELLDRAEVEQPIPDVGIKTKCGLIRGRGANQQ